MRAPRAAPMWSSSKQVATIYRFFQSPEEALAACQNFDAECILAPDKFAAFVGEYIFVKENRVSCQCLEEGHQCGQDHGHGWVIRATDGREGFIGIDCFKKFQGSEEVRLASGNMYRARTLQRLIWRIEQVLADGTLPGRIAVLGRDCTALRDSLRKLQEVLPSAAWKVLLDMARRGSGDVRVMAEYVEVEKDANGKPHEVSRREERSAGAVSAAAAAQPQTLRAIVEELESAEEALKSAEEARNQLDEQRQSVLRGWAQAAEAVAALPERIAQSQRNFEVLCRPHNLRPLCWAVSDFNSRVETARAILSMDAGEPVSNNVAKQRLLDWRREVCETLGARSFN